MDPETAREERLTATREAAAALARERRETEERAAEPPRPGDVFLFRQTAEHPVDWLVAERRSDDGRLLAVPLDEYPFTGSRDVELSARAAGGGARVRCDLGVWLEPGAFDAELRCGALAPEDLERVLDKRRRALAGRLRPGFTERQVDADPEYRQWRGETLGAALAALEGTPAEAPGRRRDSVRRWAVPLAVAASAMLVMRLASVQEVSRLRDELDGERRRADERQARIAELSAALAEPQINLPFYELAAREGERAGRGDAFRVAVPPAARRVALALEVEDPEPFPRYRLRLVERGSARVIWQTGELVKAGRWLRLDLPASFLEAGKEYELRLAGLREGRAVELAAPYLFAVERPAG